MYSYPNWWFQFIQRFIGSEDCLGALKLVQMNFLLIFRFACGFWNEQVHRYVRECMHRNTNTSRTNTHSSIIWSPKTFRNAIVQRTNNNQWMRSVYIWFNVYTHIPPAVCLFLSVSLFRVNYCLRKWFAFHLIWIRLLILFR